MYPWYTLRYALCKYVLVHKGGSEKRPFIVKWKCSAKGIFPHSFCDCKGIRAEEYINVLLHCMVIVFGMSLPNTGAQKFQSSSSFLLQRNQSNIISRIFFSVLSAFVYTLYSVPHRLADLNLSFNILLLPSRSHQYQSTQCRLYLD